MSWRMKLRPYQTEIVDYVEGAIMFGSTHLCVEAPTGSGKSVMIAEICKRYSHQKIVILVNVSKLVGQLSHHLTAVAIDHGIVKAGEEAFLDEKQTVQIVMEQTYYSRKDKLSITADIIIRDEHHIGFTGERFAEITKKLEPRVVIGFSATPYDQNGVALPGYETFSKVDIKRLTYNGFLAPAKTFITKFGQALDFSKIGKSGDYTESEIDSVLNNDEYNSNVAGIYRDFCGVKTKAIVFVSGIDHAEALAEMFDKYSVPAFTYHSKNSAKVNEINMDGFKNGQVSVLISVSSLTTGFDMPDCKVVLNCRPTKVRSLYVQMIGRVLRPTADPLAEALIIDCCRATTEHGLYDEEYVPQKDNVSAKKELEKMKQPIIDYIVKKSDIDPFVDAVHIKNNLVEVMTSTSIHAYVWRFENSTSARDMVTYGLEIYNKIWKRNYMKNLDFILKTVEPAVARDGLKVYKTRMRNIIKDCKKPASLHYFPDWYLNNRGW